jgi:hypothetical protein
MEAAHQHGAGLMPGAREGGMQVMTKTMPAMAMLLVLGASPAWAGQRDEHGRDRNGRESQGEIRRRGESAPQAHESAPPAREVAPPRQLPPVRENATPFGRSMPAAPSVEPRERAVERPRIMPDARQNDRRDERPSIAPVRPQYDVRPFDRGDERRREEWRDNDRDRVRRYDRDDRYRYDRDDRYRYGRDDGYRPYLAPRIVRPDRHYYGSGGNLSVYFGWGSGYLFGSPWSGRVYGYVAPRAYDLRVYYGDVRLQVRPRDAAVYVDGYYAGIVDDFDGVFQRLTLEVGPHTLEIDAPGLEPRFFDIYVDPARTVDVRADLY